MADVQAAKSLIEEDAYGPRGYADDETILEEQRQLEADVKRSSEDAKGKARASDDGGDDGDRAGLMGNGTARRRSSSSPKHVRLATFPPTSGQLQDGEDGYVPRRSGEYSVRRATKLSKAQMRQRYWRSAAINVLFILSWYFFATMISLYNKWMFSPDHYNFRYPLFVTTFHMAVQFVLAGLTLAMFRDLRPAFRPTRRDYLTKAAPCGAATGIDIGLSNNSLKIVTLSFYTMCKSSSLAFVLLFAFVFKLEKPTWRLIGIIAIITCGVVLMVSSDTQFVFWGMVEVLAASCMAGLRWSLTQLLLEKEKMGMGNPIATIFWLAPIMGLTLALCSAVFEGWGNVLAQDAFFGDMAKSMETMMFVVAPGVLAFLMNVSEFALIKRTSVVTLSIAGIFKEVGTIFLSTVVFGDVMTPLNISGLIVTIFGIALYNVLKYNQSMKSPDRRGSGSSPAMSNKTGSELGLTDGGMMLDEGAMPLSTPRMRQGRDEEETYFLADGTSYSHPNREYADDGDETEDDETTGKVLPYAEPVNASLIDGLDGKLHADPELARLDRQEAQLEGALDAGIHRGGPETQHVIGEEDDEDWGRSWEVEETGNGLVVPDIDRKT